MSISSISAQPADSSSSAQLPSPAEDISIKDFSGFLLKDRQEPIGQGYYSDVYRFVATETYDTVEEGKFYAVKSIRQSLWRNLDKLKKRLLREINTWSPLEHPNILKLHGAIFAHDLNSARLPCLVSDLMPNGNAAGYFEDAPPPRLVPFLLGIASGISYLHSKGIAHGDLKADNVLVTADGNACVCDFGLSRCLNPNLDGPTIPSSSDGNRASRWTAPEYLDFDNGPQAPNTEGDVWSFGCTALQLLSGKPPFFEVRSDLVVTMRLTRGHMPNFPPVLERKDFEPYRHGIFALTRLCWVKDRSKRPCIDIVKSFLDTESKSGPRTGTCRTVLRPPSPSVENMLRSINKSPISVLNEFYKGTGQRPVYEESSEGPSNKRRHFCVVTIDGREYGREEGLGKKRDIQRKAALRAVERLRQEEPTRFSELKYWPVFYSHMSRLGREVVAGISDEPEYDGENGTSIYRFTVRFDGAILSEGSGETWDSAREDAARNAYRGWDERNGAA